MKNNFDPSSDLAPIAMLARSPNAVLATAARPELTSLKGLIDYAKANPNKISYGTSGIGSQHHLGGEQISLLTGARMVHVPYKAGAQALVDLVAGQLQTSYSVIGPALPMIRAGKARALTVISDKRIPQLPDVPAMSELLPGYSMPESWFAFFGPANMPQPVVMRLNAEIARTFVAPDVKARLDERALIVITGKPEEVTGYLRNGLDVYGKIVKAAGIQPEEGESGSSEPENRGAGGARQVVR